MTASEAHERILELDDLIFKIETGQVHSSWDEYMKIKNEAEQLMVLVARTVSESGQHSYKEAYEARARVRLSNFIAAVAQRHIELHPETADKEDQFMIAAFHGGEDGHSIDPDALRAFVESYNYMFKNCPQPPAKEPPRVGFFSKLFRR